MDGLIPCPLCSQPGFSDIDTLRLTLISASTRRLICPICQEILLGLDKLTIHLVSHSLHDHLVRACFNSNVPSPLLTIVKENESVREVQSHCPIPVVEVIQATHNPNVPQFILFNLSPSVESQPLLNIAESSLDSEELHQSSSKEHAEGNPVSHQKIDSQFEVLQRTGDPCTSHEQEISLGDALSKKTKLQSSDDTQSHNFQPDEQENPYFSSIMKEDVTKEGGMCQIFTIPQNIENTCQTDGRFSYDTVIRKQDDVPRNGMVCPNKDLKAVSNHVDSDPVCSCNVCGLKFKDNSTVLLHKQLVHNQDLNHNSSSEEKQGSVFELSRPLHSQEKASGSHQMKENGNSFHRFPCHQCSKVFRMRGSLMVHLRVAHSQDRSDGIEPPLPSLPAASIHCDFKQNSNIEQPSTLPPHNSSLNFVSGSKVSDENSANAVISPSTVKCTEQSEYNVMKPLESKGSGATYINADMQMIISSGKLLSADVSKNICGTELDFQNRSNNSLSLNSPAVSPTWSLTSSPPFGTATNPSASTDSNFMCVTCNKTFLKESLLTQHMKSHEGKQWECDVCCKLFTTKYFLKKHKRLHTGEMPYTCSMCNKSFTFQQSYHKHLLYHSDDKPHTCSECGRAFKELSTLHNHQRIHTGEKPWACETCGKCFRQRVSYLVHRRIHTGAMPYQCTVCLKSFRYKVSQRTHKCTAQPPGDVVRQSDDLLQRLLLCSLRQSGPSSNSTQLAISEKESNTLHDEYTNHLKDQLQQLNIKPENVRTQHIGLVDGEPSIPAKMQCEHVEMSKQAVYDQTESKKTYLQEYGGETPTIRPLEFGVNMKPIKNNFNEDTSKESSEPVANTQLWPGYESESPFELFSADQNEHFSQRENYENVQPSSKISEHSARPCSQSAESVPPQHETLSTTSGDASGDLLQDILSMVMTPSVDHSTSPSLQNNHSSEKFSWDADPEAELHNLFYSPI